MKVMNSHYQVYKNFEKLPDGLETVAGSLFNLYSLSDTDKQRLTENSGIFPRPARCILWPTRQDSVSAFHQPHAGKRGRDFQPCSALWPA
jgi:hypothetical protein